LHDHGMAFTQAELDYLATQPLGRLATLAPDGTLQVSRPDSLTKPSWA
jgi:hypothetical protein